MRMDLSPGQVVSSANVGGTGQTGMALITSIVNNSLSQSSRVACPGVGGAGANPIATCQMLFPSQRQVNYAILPNGTVTITGLGGPDTSTTTGWKNYSMVNGTIARIPSPAPGG